jgi:hypothetical protein
MDNFQSNDTFDSASNEARMQDLASAYGIQEEPATAPEPQVQPPVETQSTENDQKFSETLETPDIATGSEESAPAQTDDPLENLLKNTFGGDPKKIAKSYVESQKAYQKLNTEHKQTAQRAQELESQFQALDQLFAENPQIAKQVERAIRGESLESQTNAAPEPYGKPMQSAPTGKLNNATLPTEKTLVEAGYIDPEAKNQLSTMEYQQLMLNAQGQYMLTEMPKMIAQQTQQQIAEQNRLAAEQQQRETLKQTNTQRFNESFDRAVVKFGLDVTSTHAHLSDEIVNATKAFRDPDNMGLISEDAVELATQRVLQRHNMLSAPTPTPTTTIQAAPTGDDGFNSTNRSGIAPTQSQPSDLTSQFEQMRLQQLTDSIQKQYAARRTE